MGEDVLSVLTEIKGLLSLGPKVPKLWSAEQIAEWMGLERWTVATRVVTRPGFPRPVVPTGTDRGQKRWFSSEVTEWLQDHRQELRTRRKRGPAAASA